MDGILNICKETGMTSHDVVARVRKLLKQRRVGHAGTLDPAASGVLPICVGLGTRVAEYLSESGKAYRAMITFGSETDTYDAEGTVLRTASTDQLTLQAIEAILPRFLGPQMQIPPRYSAIKIAGQAAYKRARAGEELVLEARPIVIESLTLISWEHPMLVIDVVCSKGTYIRSLAYDLGQVLGCGAHLSGLVRTRSGPYTLESSLTLRELADQLEQGTINELLQPPDSALAQYPAIYLDAETTVKVRQGNTFQVPITDNSEEKTLARVYASDRTFLAIATWVKETEMWQPKKVFVGE
jgi:tRNA pseudouridine55 synthase